MSDNNSQDIELPSEDNEENEFIDKCIETFEKEVFKKPLNILIWGPSEPSVSSDEYIVNLYKKRVDIRDRLKSLGHNALFSEEIGEKAEKKLGTRPNTQLFEKIQIEEADLAIMLRVSHGTIGEFHDFHNNPNYARKMCVYFDKAHRESYTHTGADEIFVTNGGKLEEFAYPNDIIECNLRGKIKDHIRKVQMAIYMSPYKKY